MPSKKRTDPDFHWVKNSKGKRVYCMKGADPDAFSPPDNPNKKFTLSKPLRETIIALYTQGLSVREIALHKDMPPQATIFQWMARYPDFKCSMKSARELRGVYMEEKAFEAAENADEFNVQSSRLKVETYKWGAEVNNPEIYGKRTKVVGDPNQPVAFIIDTGIRREGDSATPSLPPPEEKA